MNRGSFLYLKRMTTNERWDSSYIKMAELNPIMEKHYTLISILSFHSKLPIKMCDRRLRFL